MSEWNMSPEALEATRYMLDAARGPIKALVKMMAVERIKQQPFYDRRFDPNSWQHIERKRQTRTIKIRRPILPFKVTP